MPDPLIFVGLSRSGIVGRLSSMTDARHLLPLSLAAWHARRGRHEEASAFAATALEWGNEGVRTEPDLAVARTLDPLLAALRAGATAKP